MSLKPEPIDPIPAETVRVAKAAFPKGSIFMKMGDELVVLSQDGMFAGLFPNNGQPALAPWRLALVTIMESAASCAIAATPGGMGTPSCSPTASAEQSSSLSISGS